MPSTRSQATPNTRSTGRAILPLGIQGPTRAKKRKVTSRPSSSKSNDSTTAAQQPDNWKTQLSSLLWSLAERYRPWLTIVLEPIRSKYPNTVSLIVALTLVVFVLSLAGTIVAPATQLWQFLFPAELSRIYYNEVSWPPRHRWIWRLEEVFNVTREIKRLSKDHDGKQVHVYLIGGPGSGKSELARQVGRRLFESMKQNKRPVDVITIDAASVTSLLSSLTDAVLALCSHSGKKADGIKQLKEELNFKFADLFSNEGVQKTNIKLSILFIKLKELLEERNSQPVLIFDNVQDLKLLFSNLNLEPGSSHFATFVVIITVQKRVSLERLSDYVYVQDLYEGMIPTDSVKLLESITGLEEDSENHANELSYILGHQPLALSTAAIYIESVREGPPKRADYGYLDYISEFKRDIPSLGMEEEIEWRESDASKYSIPMYAAVLKAVNLSAQNDPVIRDLACIGYTDTSPLSLAYVLDFLKKNSHQHFTEAQIRNSLRNVLFKVAGKEGKQTLSSHQVIREAFRQVCKVSSKNQDCLNSPCCNLTAAAPPSNPESRVLLLGIFSRLAFSFEHQLNAAISNVYNTSLTDPNSSFGSQCLEILTSMCVFSTREHLQVADIMPTRFTDTFLRFVSHSSGFSGPAIIKPATNVFRLNEVVNLTNLQAIRGDRYDLQIVLLVVCLHSGATSSKNEDLMRAINTTSTGVLKLVPNTAKSRDTSVTLNLLGSMYRTLGYPYKSKDLHELALDVNRKSGGQNYNLVKDNASEGQIEQKESVLERATTFQKLGVTYRYLANLSLAQAYHEGSLKLLQKLLSPSHPYIAGSLLNLAVVYSPQGKHSEALQLYNQSLAILQQTYGPRHASVGRVLNTMGTIYYKLGEFYTAIYYSELGLEILQEFHGSNHPHVAEALNFLGFMYRDKGNLQKAQELLERSLGVKKKVFNANHFIVGEALNDLGVVYTRIGEARKATKVLQRALDIFKQTWGDDHTSVPTTLNSLGAAYCALRQPQQAVHLHMKALETLLRMDKGNARDHLLAETRHLLGNAFLAMGNVSAARLMYDLSYSGFRSLYKPDHWRVKGALKSLNFIDSVLNKSPSIRALFVMVGVHTLIATVNAFYDHDSFKIFLFWAGLI